MSPGLALLNGETKVIGHIESPLSGTVAERFTYIFNQANLKTQSTVSFFLGTITGADSFVCILHKSGKRMLAYNYESVWTITDVNGEIRCYKSVGTRQE